MARNPRAAKTARQRGKGRPSVESHGAVGREALIRATCELLKTTMPARITRRAVARQAGVAASLIGYYFGNTDELLIEAVVHLWRELRHRSHDAVARARTPADKLFARTKVLLETHVENPYFSQLVMEHLLRGSSAAARQATDELIQDSFSELSGILKAGIGAGKFRAADPIFLYETLLGACETFAASQRHLQMLLGGREFDRDLIEAYARFLCDLVLNGMSTAGVPAERARSRRSTTSVARN